MSFNQIQQAKKMTKETRIYQSELAVIGAGLSGCAATIFALARGIKTTQIGNTGALAYTSGYFDLLGALEGQFLKDPWSGLQQLREQDATHPYAKLTDQEILQAFNEFVVALDEMGLSYTMPADLNHLGMLPAGACKPTFCMPCTMQKSTLAMSSKARVLIIDFEGLQGFSAKEIVSNLKSQWPQLRSHRLTFPQMETGAQVFPEVMARAMEVAKTREELANKIKAVAGDAEYIAMPAMLGIHKPDVIHAEIEKLLGLSVFEIPTIPPAVAGIRLRELLEQQLSKQGASIVTQQKVQRVSFEEKLIRLFLHDSYGPLEVEANHVVLASGRFLSGGLISDQNSIKEALIGLPVCQPESRESWFRDAYFDPAGHAVNRAGIEVNNQFQVIDQYGNLIDKSLYACGILLAHQDWIRQRCGAGLAIATSYKAIQSISNRLLKP